MLMPLVLMTSCCSVVPQDVWPAFVVPALLWALVLSAQVVVLVEAAGIVAHCLGSSLFGHCYASWHHSRCLGNTIVPCCHTVARTLCPTSCRLLFDSLWPSDLVGHICSILLLDSFLFLDCWLLCSFLVRCLFLSLAAILPFLLLFLLPCRGPCRSHILFLFLFLSILCFVAFLCILCFLCLFLLFLCMLLRCPLGPVLHCDWCSLMRTLVVEALQRLLLSCSTL